ncbi:MAG: hypothetical protein AAF439_14730 [Pseudomonadota bacterium]
MSPLALIVLIAAVAGGIIAFGLWAGNRMSSPQTKALTSLISAHKLQDTAVQLAAMEQVLGVFELAPQDRIGVSDQDLDARITQMLNTAEIYDSRYGRYHWGIRAAALIASELKRQGLGKF